VKKLKKLIAFLLPFIIGGAIGFIGVRLTGGGSADEAAEPVGLFTLLLGMVLLLLIFYLGFLFHVTIHEAGHFIAGKLSGYTFVSFRVGSFTLIKKDGKIIRKKYNVAGTGGQCLMSPPDVSDENYRYPYVFYNMGGGLMNIIFGSLFLFIGLANDSGLAFIIVILGIFGLVLGLANIIPMKAGGIANDGMNAVVCRNSAKERRALWVQLKYAGLITQGVRPRDMPEEWGLNTEEIKSPLSGFLVTFRHHYLLDKGELNEARAYAQHILDNPGKMLEIYQNELRCELLFHELIDECRNDEIEKMYDDKVRKYIKSMYTFVSKKRLMYAYNCLYLKDGDLAGKALKEFEKACKHSPFEGEIAGERELMELITAKAELP
jgi:hypothetical protein